MFLSEYGQLDNLKHCLSTLFTWIHECMFSVWTGLFKKYLLTTYCLAGNVVGPGNSSFKADEVPPLKGAVPWISHSGGVVMVYFLPVWEERLLSEVGHQGVGSLAWETVAGGSRDPVVGVLSSRSQTGPCFPSLLRCSFRLESFQMSSVSHWPGFCSPPRPPCGPCELSALLWTTKCVCSCASAHVCAAARLDAAPGDPGMAGCTVLSCFPWARMWHRYLVAATTVLSYFKS